MRLEVSELAQQYVLVEGQDRLKIIPLILTRAAALCEDDKDLEKAAGFWGDYGAYIDGLLVTDPRAAFEFAVSMTRIKREKDTSDSFAGWICGNGLELLTRPELKQLLIDYLRTPPKPKDLIRKIKEFLEFNTQQLDTISIYTTPESFSKIMSLLIIFGIEKHDNVLTIWKLVENANDAMRDPDMKRVLAAYLDLPGMEYIYHELMPRVPD